MKPRLALVTSQELPELFGGEKLLLPALADAAVQFELVIWDDPLVNWHDFDLILIRCTWDYHEKLEAFHAWLKRLSKLPARVINEVPLMLWNLDKTYLFELQKLGVRIIPSVLLLPNDPRSLHELIDAMQVDEIVVKPVQSAGAWRTLRVDRQNAATFEQDFSNWRRQQSFLLQAYMPEIVKQGEWSLIFFNSKYSHSLLKSAKAGDFRVQSDHGGTVAAQVASQSMQNQALQILQKLPSMPSYARVDGIMRDGEFFLMEIELIEPELFLELDAAAPQRFAEAIVMKSLA